MSPTAEKEQTQEVKQAYDKNARQIAKFAKEDNDARYDLTFAIEGLSDEDLIEFDRLTISTQKLDGNTIVLENDDLEACVWFFKKNVLLVDGFEGELPGDWQKEFDALEMQEIVRAFLDQRIFVESESKAPQKYTFGKSRSNKVIKIVAPFNGKEELLAHELPANASDFIGKFKRITRPSEMKKGDEGISAPDTWENLGALYDEMGIKTNEADYAQDGVPLHHKVLALRENFGANLQRQTKKPIR